MPATLVMFALSKRFGRLADRLGPRLFMGVGPLVAAAGLALMLRIDADLDYFTDLLPALLVFSLGLALTVAPLTATVLADADESNAGIASGVNNAIARVAGLLAVAALGAVVAAQFSSALDEQPRRAAALPPGPGRGRRGAQARRSRASIPREAGPGGRRRGARPRRTSAFHVGIGISAALVALGGVLGLAGIRNPRRDVRCEDCAGGQFAGQPLDAAREPAGAGRGSGAALGLANLQNPLYAGLPAAIQRSKSSTCSAGQVPSQGYAPCLDRAENRVRMPARRRRGTRGRRRSASRSRSRSRQSGLTSSSKLTGSLPAGSLHVCLLCHAACLTRQGSERTPGARAMPGPRRSRGRASRRGGCRRLRADRGERAAMESERLVVHRRARHCATWTGSALRPATAAREENTTMLPQRSSPS